MSSDTLPRILGDLTSTEFVRLEHAVNEILSVNDTCRVLSPELAVMLDSLRTDLLSEAESRPDSALPGRSKPSGHLPRQARPCQIPERVSSLAAWVKRFARRRAGGRP